jgi:CRISPR-associated RAMP protein, Csm4 family
MTTLFKLRFPSGISLYDNRHILHSDTLWSAICNAANLLFGSSAVETLRQSNTTLISSAFPFVGEEIFFPRPLSFYKEPENYAEQKKFKKVRFISEKIWTEMISGKFADLKKGFIQSVLWFEKAPKLEAFSVTVERPRVTLDRVSISPTLFSSEETFYDESVGFFFLAEFENDDIKQIFSSALRLLSAEGIGAERSVGKGWFRVEEASYQLQKVQNPNVFLLLSLYTPTEDELSYLDVDNSFYEIVERGGWVTSCGGMTMRRKKVRAFSEGSVLRFKKGTPKGQIVEVLSMQQSLTHNVYRNLQAFAIPIQLGE